MPPPIPLIPAPVWNAVVRFLEAVVAAIVKAVGVAEVAQLIKDGKKQEAIDKAIKVYNIDTSHTKSITYDASVHGEAETAPDGTVTVGDAAFRDAGWLGSSVGHEVEVHVNQQAHVGNWYTGPVGTHLQEVQAYDYEIANADRYGTPAANLTDLQHRRDDHYNALPADYQTRVDGGDYTMKPGEEKK